MIKLIGISSGNYKNSEMLADHLLNKYGIFTYLNNKYDTLLIAESDYYNVLDHSKNDNELNELFECFEFVNDFIN